MKVEVVKYNPKWVEEFIKESKELESQIGNVINNNYHIGSTAVPGLMAKPIIDIILDVNSLTQLDNQSSKLESREYEVMGELRIVGRRYFRKGGNNRTHQIHAFQSGDFNIIRHLAFRDYLMEHKMIAKDYGELKFNIAKTCNNDIEKYCDEKDDFVQHHEALAINWYKKITDTTCYNRPQASYLT